MKRLVIHRALRARSRCQQPENSASTPPQRSFRSPSCRCTEQPPLRAPLRFQPVTLVSGSIDLGYRWVTGVAEASTLIARSSISAQAQTARHRLHDSRPQAPLFRPHRRARLRLGRRSLFDSSCDAKKAKLYDFSGDYRNIAYYNNLPAFADPFLAKRLILNEQALDTRKRIGDLRLELFPQATSSRISNTTTTPRRERVSRPSSPTQ